MSDEPSRATAPAGYRDPGMAEPAELRPVIYVSAEIVMIAVLFTATSRELLFRAPHAFLSPLAPPWFAVPASVTIGSGLGAALALRGTSGAGPAARSLAVTGALAVLLPWCFRVAFALAARSPLYLWVTVALAAATLSHTAVACVRWLARDARDLGVAVDLLSPFRLAQSALVLAITFAAIANLPPLHAGAALGACLAVTSLGTAPLARFLSARDTPRSATPLALFALLAAAASAFFAERHLPLAEARSYVGQVVMTGGGVRQRVALVSFGSHFELYVDRALRMSELDQERYPEALVHPARLAVPDAKRALLLGGGLGLVERELLRASPLAKLTVVTTDLALPALVESAPWPGEAARAALRDPRVYLVEDEPAVFVETCKERFDLVVIDADDPIGYREAKHYTRHFYRSVAKLFADSSVMVVQLPSPLTFPDSHANALATLRAAGLDVVPYRAALPALGEWGFALASPKSSSVELSERVLAARHRLPPGLRYVTAVNLDGLFALPRDVKGEDGAVSTLGAPTIVELYARENALR